MKSHISSVGFIFFIVLEILSPKVILCITNSSHEILPPSASEQNDKLNFINITSIIQQLINSTFIFTPTTTTKVTTVAPTTSVTSSTTKASCKCGAGAKPKITFPTLLRESLESSGENHQDKEDDDVFEINWTSSPEEKLAKGPGDEERIVHGVASNPNGWPWMAFVAGMFTNTTTSQLLVTSCGGSLINSQYVITAAHCFQNFKTASDIVKNFTVTLGTNSISTKVSPKTVVKLAAVTVHPKFSLTTLDNDIAILKLAVPLNFSSTISPICLSQIGTPFSNRKVIAAGWGATDTNGMNLPMWLREAGLKTMPNAKCTAIVPNLTNNMICATGVVPSTQSDTCSGDSGGPLMIWRPKAMTYSLVGLTSFGPKQKCAQKGIPGVYTRVNNYLSFIKTVTNGTSFCSNSF